MRRNRTLAEQRGMVYKYLNRRVGSREWRMILNRRKAMAGIALPLRPSRNSARSCGPVMRDWVLSQTRRRLVRKILNCSRQGAGPLRSRQQPRLRKSSKQEAMPQNLDRKRKTLDRSLLLLYGLAAAGSFAMRLAPVLAR